MTDEEVLNFAKSKGYADISEKTRWNGYDVYEFISSIATSGKIVFTGRPVYVLVKGEQIRFATPEEGGAFNGFKYPD